MKLVMKCGDPEIGMSLGEVRQFVAAAEGVADNEYIDCFVPGDKKGSMDYAALMGLELEALVGCPRCGEALIGSPAEQHRSRVDNRTLICFRCGNDEALWEKAHYDKYEKPPPLPPLTGRCWP